MKHLLITFIAIFYVAFAQGQDPCDAEMKDTLTNSENKHYLKDFSWSKDVDNSETKEYSVMLRKNTKYNLQIGNSTYSETPIQFEFIYFETTKVRQEEQEIEVTNSQGYDTTVTTRPVKHELTGNKRIIEKIKIPPGKVSSFDFTIPATSSCKMKITNTKPGYICNHFTLFFVKQLPASD